MRHARNRGKGAALRTGFREASARGFTHAVSIDADGQHFPRDIPDLIEAGRRSPDALVVGARALEGLEHVQGKTSLGRALSNFWVLLVTGVPVSDTPCGLRVRPLNHMSHLHLDCERFDLEVEVIVRAAWAGLPVLSAPVSVHYPPPQERISHFDVFRDNARISYLNATLLARRLVPWPHRRLVPRVRRTLRERIAAVATEGSSPTGLGLAVALGCVCATSPFFGVQTFLALGIATFFRLNRPATLLGSFVTTPPLTIPIVGASVEIGSLLLDGRTRPWPDHVDVELFRSVFFQWLVGGVVIGSALGLLLGTLTALLVARSRARRNGAAAALA